MGSLFEIILPYGTSSIIAGLAAGLLEKYQAGKLAAILLEWLAENSAYYITAWFCKRFRIMEQKQADSEKEPLKEMIVVEAFDIMVRLGLFWLASELPERHRSLGALAATSMADISFMITLKRSHQLLKICEAWSNRPRPLVLRFEPA